MIAPHSGRIRLCALLALTLPLLLAACSSDTGSTASRVLEEVLESHRASMTSLGAPPSPPSAPATGRASPGSVAALMGQPPDAVIAALGQPTRRRPEGDAEIWLYQGRNCALDVILYGSRNTARVTWAAARANGTGRQTETGCLVELVTG
ncbi:hypothetical protein [Roseomonas xinghualingensis]|uniref:hypothetical protein n=1 Tax=Roseomonas xinghualingensis TaxID=2986475 RepID=UPI0021F1D8D7|nr:hypothetical protein [Roseomonas sp. SXEYE001]MCV4206180.1 hypothetical protein [Roseomonas sp. SXEYE001]